LVARFLHFHAARMKTVGFCRVLGAGKRAKSRDAPRGDALEVKHGQFHTSSEPWIGIDSIQYHDSRSTNPRGKSRTSLKKVVSCAVCRLVQVDGFS
jgi:hypothetical protein